MHARLTGALLRAAAQVSTLWVVLTLLLFAWLGRPLWQDPAALASLAGFSWNPAAGQYGLGAMFAGTLLLSSGALLLAFPLGLLCTLFVLALGPRALARPLRQVLTLMAGVPTIVYAFVAVWLLVPWLRDSAGVGMGFSWLAASLTLGLMLVPTVALPLIGVLAPADAALAPACDALGLRRVQRLLWITLPAHKPLMLSVLLVAAGRAAGDTLIALMLSGNAPWLPQSPADPLRVLSAHIALSLATDTESTAYAAIYASSLLLLAWVGFSHALSRRLMR